MLWRFILVIKSNLIVRPLALAGWLVYFRVAQTAPFWFSFQPISGTHDSINWQLSDLALKQDVFCWSWSESLRDSRSLGTGLGSPGGFYSVFSLYLVLILL